MTRCKDITYAGRCSACCHCYQAAGCSAEHNSIFIPSHYTALEHLRRKGELGEIQGKAERPKAVGIMLIRDLLFQKQLYWILILFFPLWLALRQIYKFKRIYFCRGSLWEKIRYIIITVVRALDLKAQEELGMHLQSGLKADLLYQWNETFWNSTKKRELSGKSAVFNLKESPVSDTVYLLSMNISNTFPKKRG